MKKKYFILFSESDVLPARLEYYDSEKKWRNGQTPKRSAQLCEIIWIDFIPYYLLTITLPLLSS